jgi:enoyl-[acyl-carrier protein] reductase III
MDAGAAIVAISSLGAQRVLDNYVLVGTSKAALESVVRYLGVELAPRGIRVNAVVGGLLETDASRLHPDFDALAKEAVARAPIGRLIKTSDIADAVLFLCSPLADAIVGQMLVVDGGAGL